LKAILNDVRGCQYHAIASDVETCTHLHSGRIRWPAKQLFQVAYPRRVSGCSIGYWQVWKSGLPAGPAIAASCQNHDDTSDGQDAEHHGFHYGTIYAAESEKYVTVAANGYAATAQFSLDAHPDATRHLLGRG
jgi:hypothetical protein